jgi:hypothetical protein
VKEEIAAFGDDYADVGILELYRIAIYLEQILS